MDSDSGTTLAERFATALSDEDTQAGAEPELLPVRLARAVARVLPADGAGLSLLDGADRRSPLGASDEESGRAERLQFTVGTGPCLTAHESGQPVFVVEEDLRRRWPAFHDLLVVQTPFRGVVALPLRNALAGRGAMDLYFTDPADVAGLDVFAAMTAGDLAVQRLSEAAVWSDWSAEQGPGWLHSPPAVRRAEVWQAAGMVGLTADTDMSRALALLRGYAYAAGRTVDEVAHDMVSGHLDPAEVQVAAGARGRPDAGD
jgi:hypothetical protein